jgi:hypothetical protein
MIFLNKTAAKSDNATLKGYTISKIDSVQKKNSLKRTKKIEVTNLEANEVTIYPSFTLAGKALGVAPSSLSGYFAKKSY